MTNDLAPPTIAVTSRAAELDAEVRMLIARSGIPVGEWVVLKAIEAAVVLSPTDAIRLKPSALLEAVARIRAASPKSEAIAAGVAAIARNRLGRELLCEVQQGEVTVLAAFPILLETVGANVRSRLRIELPLPALADAALRAREPDAEAIVARHLAAALADIEAWLAVECADAGTEVGAFVSTLSEDEIPPFVTELMKETLSLAPFKSRRSKRADLPGRVRKALSFALDKALTTHSAEIARTRFKRSVGYHDFVNLHPVARGLSRQLTLIVGPTNSGKTYEALRVAMAAPTSRILSPLRLLALEHYETLHEAGLEACMLTGEEMIGLEDAPHRAQTIETMDADEVVDVVVIDEIQMLFDRNRGWAWSEALVGAPGRHVVMTGSLDCVDAVSRIAAMTGETLEVRSLPRKTPLVVERDPVGLEDVGQGDAVIAFSRKAVFEVRERLMRRGLTVAAVYGALSPEVRRAESRRFREGEAEVLVATDAIGMGLNIGPLKRIVFSSLSKFDGTETRSLTAPEIRQVAGRAGRFGFAEAGYVAVLKGHSPSKVAEAIDGRPRQVRLDRLLVRPSMGVMRAAARENPSEHLVEILDRVVAMLKDDAQVELGDMTESFDMAALLRHAGLPVPTAWLYVCSPTDGRNPAARETLLSWARSHAAGRPVAPPPLRPGELRDFEDYGRIASLYLWLSRRFPAIYPDGPRALASRAANDRRIEAALAVRGAG